MAEEAGQVYARRRTELLERLAGERGALVLPAAPVVVVGRDLELPYHPDADLLYLTGYAEPGAVLVLAPGHEEAPFTLFVRPRNPAEERWSGVRGGLEAALERFGADAAFPIEEFDERIGSLLGSTEVLYFPFGRGAEGIESRIRTLLSGARHRGQRTGRALRTLHDPGLLLDEMRLVKDAHELALLADAARISAEGFRDAARAIRPGTGEWEVEAALEFAFRRRGSDGPAFATIAASGANALVLHYIENRSTLQTGELLLIDAGARYRHYNGDISRTFPVSGRFTPAQRELYDAVLSAHDRAITTVRPGVPVAEVHLAAVRALTEAMLALGLLEGSVDTLIEEGAYRAYYPHQTSHWLGLDVHDVGDYALDGTARPLLPGMVLTVEPGLYIPADDEKAPAELRGVGIRIEDDVVVTESGHEILTAALPSSAEEIEALLG
jgi:Xaa-Pro aminopeptidase